MPSTSTRRYMAQRSCEAMCDRSTRDLAEAMSETDTRHALPPPRNQVQEPAFLVHFALKLRFLVLDFGVYQTEICPLHLSALRSEGRRDTRRRTQAVSSATCLRARWY
eukprot:2368868-Rhodomonas_salina.1